MKIYVGTANWGQEYGINKVKVSPGEIDKILEVADANDCGIETAWDYNCMEALRGLSDQFDIIFKCDTAEQLEASRQIMGRSILPMKHHPPYRSWANRSIYSPEYHSDYVTEFPYNIVDQRFRYYSGTQMALARSVFIQGLAFGMPDFHGIPFYHLCWNFVRNNPNIDGIVVGVDTSEQLKDILSIPNYEIDYGNIGGDGWIKTL
jgi:hypothetical protein